MSAETVPLKAASAPSTGASRRTVLKAATALGAGLAMPAIVSPRVLASSGEINVLMWADYLPETFRKAFTDKTGIKVNFTGVGSNEEVQNKLMANGGRGFDIISPTADRSLLYQPLNALQPFDVKRVPMDHLNPTMAKIGENAWNFDNKGPHWLPNMWGTEGIAWRVDGFKPDGQYPSYMDPWDDKNAGKSMVRAQSGLMGAGLALERTGQMEPGSVWSSFQDQDKMKKVWTQITDFCISKKKNIKILWNDADTQKNALLNEGVIVAQTWDGPILALKTQGEPIMYRAPVEGSLAWVDGVAMPKLAVNIDQVYAFLEACYDPALAGEAITHHGYNSPVIGAEKYAGEAYAKNFADAYPGDALAKLNPWPPAAQWFADARAEYVNKFLSA